MIQEEESRANALLDELNPTRRDSESMFNAIKKLRRLQPRKPLIVKDSSGQLVTQESNQAEIVRQHFQKQFWSDTQEPILISPQEMTPPFTSDEIKQAVKHLKNGKALTAYHQRLSNTARIRSSPL